MDWLGPSGCAEKHHCELPGFLSPTYPGVDTRRACLPEPPTRIERQINKQMRNILSGQSTVKGEAQ